MQPKDALGIAVIVGILLAAGYLAYLIENWLHDHINRDD